MSIHVAEFAHATGAGGKAPPVAQYTLEPNRDGPRAKGRWLRVANRGASDIALAFTDDPRNAQNAGEHSLPLSAGSVEYFEVEPGTTLNFVEI